MRRDRHANELGAAGTGLAALKALQCGDARPSDLAARLHVGPSVVSRAIVPLEQGGLIERKPDPKDARACQLSLTPLGTERLDSLQEGYVDRVRARFADWSDADAVYATTILAALERALADDQLATEQAALTKSLIPAGLATESGLTRVRNRAIPRALRRDVANRSELATPPRTTLHRPPCTEQDRTAPLRTDRRHRFTMTTTVAPRRVDQAGTVPGAPMSHRQILESMTGLLAALFTAMLSSTIVSVALPTIIGDLHGTQRQYTWVITAALLATTVSTPIWGKLADLFDKKLLVQIAIGIFVAGSVAAGFSHTVPFLLSMRVVQGLGMGGLIALVQAIMGSIIAPRERGRYAGYMGAVMAVSTVSGPLLGGLIVDTALGWRWTFFVCVPLAIISLFVIQATLHVAVRCPAAQDRLPRRGAARRRPPACR